MKHLTLSLLIAFLCFSLTLSCGADTPVETRIDSAEKEKQIKKSNIDKMNAALKAQNRNPKTNPLNNSNSTEDGNDPVKQSSDEMRKRYEDVMNNPANKEQIRIANKICACLNDIPIFEKMKKAKTKAHVFAIAGHDNDSEVKPLQDCYNKNMIPAVKELGKDASVFSIKARNYLNDQCLDGTDSFWISIGGYLGRNKDKEAVRIDQNVLN